MKARGNIPRNIVLTGANNGIGLAMTKSLLRKRDRVAALDLSVENLDQSNPNLLAFTCDVTNPLQV